MRRLFIPLICVPAILITWALCMSYTSHTSEKMIDTVNNELVPYIYMNEWIKADESYYELQSKWVQARCRYTLFMPSALLTDIDMSFKRSKGYIDTKNKSLAIGELSSISEHLYLLIDNQTLSVDNIF